MLRLRYVLIFVIAMSAFVGAGCARVQQPTSAAVVPVPPVYVPITIEEPTTDALVGNPIIARGKGIAFENTIQLRVRDANGRTLGETNTIAFAPDYDRPGPWSAAVAYRTPPNDSPTGVLEAYESSAKDGSELHVVRTPIRFATETQDVRVLFLKEVGITEHAVRCSVATSAFSRSVPKTPAIARATLEALLAGPTREEVDRGYRLAMGATLGGVTIADGVATVDLHDLPPPYERDGDDSDYRCDASQLATQLRATLTQFPTIQSVRILVGGKPHSLFP
ncbi:GerMN domain-containing protein [Candidatus Uhrbacteria bacterium]|nr:GerMN domain-containing protein [Candidatus Uhrbacteria bacterium]